MSTTNRPPHQHDRGGNPYENAKAESFFRTLKMKEVYLKTTGRSRKRSRT
jgi:hypothetical protein